MRRRRRALLGLAVGLVTVPAVMACGGDGPTADEELVCSTLQAVVDDLAASRSQEAIDTMNDLQSAVNATTNPRLAAAGRQFFDDLVTDVDRFQLTVEESVELGRQYARAASESLGSVIDECAAAGAHIERLPTA